MNYSYITEIMVVGLNPKVKRFDDDLEMLRRNELL